MCCSVPSALGDFVYKRCETVPAEQQAVTAFPEVSFARAGVLQMCFCTWFSLCPARDVPADTVSLIARGLAQIITEDRVPKDEFIVLACDGIWDVMSSQEVVDKVRDMLLHGRPKEPPEGQGEVPLRALER